MNSEFGRKINSVNDFKFVAYWVSQEVGFETDLLEGNLLRICFLDHFLRGM